MLQCSIAAFRHGFLLWQSCLQQTPSVSLHSLLQICNAIFLQEYALSHSIAPFHQCAFAMHSLHYSSTTHHALAWPPPWTQLPFPNITALHNSLSQVWTVPSIQSSFTSTDSAAMAVLNKYALCPDTVIYC